MMKLLALVFLLGCTNKDTTIHKQNLLGSDYRLFQNTPVWELTKSVEADDTVKISLFLKNHTGLIDFREPVYGHTLLELAVYNQNFNSVKTLLAFGADPNKQDNHDAFSPVMVAARLGLGDPGFSDPRYLKILLKYGGDPNAVQNGDIMKRNKSYFTPLFLACLSGKLEYVKILVENGADIKYTSSGGFNSLYASIVGDNPKITLFLLQKGADFNKPMYTTVQGQNKYLLDAMKNWNFEKDTEKYKTEKEILDFLALRGIK